MKKTALLITLMSFGLLKSQPIFNYPATKKVVQTDDYFGTKVEDAYRWLEDDRSAETTDWVKAQNEITNSYFSKRSIRGKIQERLTRLWNYNKESVPFKKGNLFFLF